MASPAVQFVDSGSCLLNLVLGGGYAVGRVINICGDKAVGKTLLAVEACQQFSQIVKNVEDIRYIECEHAFNEIYGKQIGMPPGVKPVSDIQTVEELFKDLDKFCTARKGKNRPALYVIDSLDALSDEAEMKRDISQGSFGAAKAAQLSELFRRQIAIMSDANCTLLVVSQLRDKIGVMFGEKHSRSGGRALSFYASQEIWLAETKKLTRQIKGETRVIGARVRVRCKKNKVGTPFRDAELTVWFSYGVDDEGSMLDYLQEHKVETGDIDLKDVNKSLLDARKSRDRKAVAEINGLLRALVVEHWASVEEGFQPPLTKYA